MARPAKREFKVVRSPVPNGPNAWYIVGRPEDDKNGKPKRVRAWFPTKEKAQAEATERNARLRKNGTEVDAILAQYGKTVHDAVAFYAAFLRKQHSSKPLDTFLAEYRAEIEVRVASGSLRKGAFKAIKETFVKLNDRFGSTLLAR